MSDYDAVGLFCEDIREEVNNMHTLVGVYARNLNISGVPGQFTKLGIYVRVNLDVKFEVKEMKLSLRFPDGEEVAIGEGNLDNLEEQRRSINPDDPPPYIGVVMRATAQNLPISSLGRILAIVRINGRETVAAALNLKLSPNAAKIAASASEQPSLQSQPASPQT